MKNANTVFLVTWCLISTMIVCAATFYSCKSGLPDSSVYELYKTPEGELGVRCLNGADATIRPSAVFGEIAVSCGK